MNPYTNEDLMWERLKDIQREVENSRLYRTSRPRTFRLPEWLGRVFTRRPHEAPVVIEDESTISDVA